MVSGEPVNQILIFDCGWRMARFAIRILFSMNGELPEESWMETAAYLLGWREIFLVEGVSMFPTLKDGDRVFINPRRAPRIGDIVLARHPFKQKVKIIKRLGEITVEGAFFLVGDNQAESTDSRSFGAIQAKDFLGVAVCRLK